MRVGKCWSFSRDEQPPYPTIEVAVSSADRRVTINPKVDTGFDGSLAIGVEAVRSLRLRPVGTVLVEAATTTCEVPIYVVNLSQPDLAVAGLTLAIGTRRSLVGRRLLESRAWLLDCKEGRLCMLTQTEATGRDSSPCGR